MIKFCKDCKWAERSLFGLVTRHSLCLNPLARNEQDLDYSLVTGNQKDCTEPKYAVNARDKYGKCGPDAKLFEARK